MKQTGDKYFKYENGKLEIIRVHNVKNDIITISRGVNKTKVKEDFFEGYVKLNPDGYIHCNIVNMGPKEEHGQDVVVTLNKKKDLDNKNGIPCVVCRLNIFDIYSNQINRSGKTYLGMCMSPESTPEGVDYKSMLSCYSIEYSEKISVYMDDSIDTILSMVSDISKFNRVIYKLYKALKGSEYIVTCKSVKSMLEDSQFDYEFKRAFDIFPIDFVVKTNEYELINEQRIILENLFKVEMFKTYVVPYSKEIDLNKIQRHYILVSDKLNKIYIIAYDKGEYINRQHKQIIRTKQDMINSLNIIKNKI